MSTKYEIPLSPMPQTFAIAMAGVTYNMLVLWNRIARCWVLDISDANNNPIVMGIPLVTGGDLLAPYPDKNFGGTLTVSTDGNTNAIPTLSNLGQTSHVYFTTTP